MQSEVDDKEEAKNPKEISNYWQVQLALAERDHKDFTDDGKTVIARYKSEQRDIRRSKPRKFNILFSNTEVLRSALYGRTAKPDVSRRFTNQDKLAGDAAEVMERALIETADSNDPDPIIDSALQDFLLPGRGVIRVCYEPELGERPAIDPMTAQPQIGEDGQPVNEQYIADQKTYLEYVYWEDYLTPAIRAGEKRPWEAFRRLFTREQLKKDFPEVAGDVSLNWSPEALDRKKVPEYTQKAEVWEIWDGDDKQRIWIQKGFDRPLRVDPDPYHLEGFFCAEPLSSYTSTDSTVPIAEFNTYKDQADDLDEITARISKLTRALKRRGVYDQSVKELKRLANAQDNEFIAVPDYQKLTQKGGLAAAFQTEDISIIAKVLLELYKQKDMLVQATYEITGISDIMRGSTDASETLGAQQLKAQFGSARVKRRQRAIQKWIRNLYRLKAEIIAEHFEPEILSKITQLQVTPEIMQVLRSDADRRFKVDIETDSTIFEDAENEKKSRVELITALTSFMEGWGPIVGQQPALLPLAFQLLKFAVAGFRTDRQVEEAIDQAEQSLTQAAQQQMQQPQQNPEMVKTQGQIAAIQAKTQGELQVEHARLGTDLVRSTVEHHHKLTQAEQQALHDKEAAAAQPKPTIQ